MRALALRDLCIAVAVVACGCAAEPSRSYYDDLDSSADATRSKVGGGDSSVPDDAGIGDDAPDPLTDASEETADDATLEAAPPAEGGPPEASADEGAPPVEASADAPTESGPSDASADAAPDAGPDAAVDAGCGPTNTTSNCGACGAACGNEHVSTASCTGSACAYTCQTGYSNCLETSPNTQGCECATPACCGNACQTTHDVGPSGSYYYDCNAVVTTSTPRSTLIRQALAACAAYTKNAADCQQAVPGCHSGLGPYVCNGAIGGPSTCTICWSYGGSDILQNEDCSCPTATVYGPWN